MCRCVLGLGQGCPRAHPLHHGRPYAQRARYREHPGAVTAHGPYAQYCCVWGAGTAKADSLLSSPCQPSHDTLPDHGAFELGKDAHHLEHGFAGRRGGVEALLVQVQADVAGMELGEDADQILQATAQPIHGPGCDEVELAPGNSREHGMQAWSLVAALCAADAVVGEGGDDLPVEPRGYGL